MEVLNVSAIIVTRGDVLLNEVVASLPAQWERVIWNNALGQVFIASGKDRREVDVEGDLAVYGRYAAIEHAAGDLIYVQDDDVIVSDPQAIVDAWLADAEEMRYREADPALGRDGISDHLVANMPTEFRHDFYREHCLVGFGAVFHRETPYFAFERWNAEMRYLNAHEGAPPDLGEQYASKLFHRTCDVVFTTLTPRVLVDVPKRNLPWATAPNRMYMTGAQHVGERMRMLELARKVRDA